MNTVSTPAPKLGSNQHAILRTLVNSASRTWYPCCGWTWDNPSTTRRLLDSLVEKGLVECYIRAPKPYGYRATEAGINLVLGMTEAEYQEKQDTMRKEMERQEAERRAAFEARERRFAQVLPHAFLAARLAIEAGHRPGEGLAKAAVQFGAKMDPCPGMQDIARVLGMTLADIARLMSKETI